MSPSSFSYTFIESPLGRLLLVATDADSLVGLYLENQKYLPSIAADWHQVNNLPLFILAASQLDEYFHGDRSEFELPLAPVGSTFAMSVWQELQRIPAGRTRTYGEIARSIGRDGAARAVGAAAGRNPIAIIIPCHRAIGANGKLTGYAGGLDRKQWLLDRERRI
jgi:methylated-DNA-[protein]-cysteine S-methyltransferase